MDLQKINVKFFAVAKEPVALTAFIDIFHSWIQATDGTYHDVADYSHMKSGPGIVLVAHDANVHIDETGGRRGLLYNRKTRLPGANREKLRVVLRAALENCRKLEYEPAMRGKLKFSGDEVLLSINDRLLAPNTQDTFNQVRRDIEAVAQQLFGGAAFTLHRDADGQKRFNVTLQTPQGFDVRVLLENLQTHDGARSEI